MKAKLILEDKSTFIAESFGAPISSSGEIVFATGMVGYPESLTDPSYKGQILTMTYPLIGNYGVPPKNLWESARPWVSGLIVSTLCQTPSHYQSQMTLAEWFQKENLPLIQIKDTRLLTQKIRQKGAMLGKIIIDKDIPFQDPNKENLVAGVSTSKIFFVPSIKKSNKTVILIDCGAKLNIIRSLANRGANVVVVPWDMDIFTPAFTEQFKKFALKSSYQGIVLSNGPGDPKIAKATINTVKKILDNKIPTLGICLGNQILALAAGGDTKKLKFGHRGQNQPCLESGTSRCYITTQNHGFEVAEIPPGFKPWFINANDNSNEGIIHHKKLFMSTQFHPEATPGPEDTAWIFDYFLEKI